MRILEQPETVSASETSDFATGMPMQRKLAIAVGVGGGGLVFLAVIVWTCLRVRAKRAADAAAAAGVYSQYTSAYFEVEYYLVHRQICTIASPNMYFDTDSSPVAVGYPCNTVEPCKAVDCIVVMENDFEDSKCSRVSGKLGFHG